MGKVLFWIVAILAAMVVVRILTQKKSRPEKPPNLSSRPSRGKPMEPMVRCAHCGIHLPRSEALMSNHHTWCSLEHAKRGPRS